MSKSSPLKIDPFTIGLLVYGAGLAGQGYSTFSGLGKRKQEQKDAEEEYRKRFSDYEKLDTSNIYADIKNPYEAVKNPYSDLDTRFENVFEDVSKHVEINLISICKEIPNEMLTKIQENASSSVKRIVNMPSIDGISSILPFLETKTVWHPKGT